MTTALKARRWHQVLKHLPRGGDLVLGPGEVIETTDWANVDVLVRNSYLIAVEAPADVEREDGDLVALPHEDEQISNAMFEVTALTDLRDKIATNEETEDEQDSSDGSDGEDDGADTME